MTVTLKHTTKGWNFIKLFSSSYCCSPYANRQAPPDYNDEESVSSRQLLRQTSITETLTETKKSLAGL